jgi:hypothetical protein
MFGIQIVGRRIVGRRIVESVQTSLAMCRMGFVTGGPNEAIVVSGCFHRQPLIVVGGWAFVIPCIQVAIFGGIYFGSKDL